MGFALHIIRPFGIGSAAFIEIEMVPDTLPAGVPSPNDSASFGMSIFRHLRSNLPGFDFLASA